LAFEKLAALQNEEAIDEILVHLIELDAGEKTRIYNLSKHTGSIEERYGETLQKLAQPEEPDNTLTLNRIFDNAKEKYGDVLKKLAE
jgi:translation elongation factor EF-1alpha